MSYVLFPINETRSRDWNSKHLERIEDAHDDFPINETRSRDWNKSWFERKPVFV